MLRLHPLIHLLVGLVATGCCALTLAQSSRDDCNAIPDQRVLTADSLALPAQALWLGRQRISWPGQAMLAHMPEPEAGQPAEHLPSPSPSSSPSSSTFRLYHSRDAAIRIDSQVHGADGAITLLADDDAALRVAEADLPALPQLLREQLVLVHEDEQGHVLQATRVQPAAALDDWFRAAGQVAQLGASVTADATRFQLWAPTAQRVALCLYPDATAGVVAVQTMHRDPHTGVWQGSKAGNQVGHTYQYLVDVWVPGVGMVRNRVTDPYSVSLTTDSRRTAIIDLNAASTKPPGWDQDIAPATVHRPTDMTVYELHVRDFSINDQTVSAAHRGKFLAFTESGSDGMRHLTRLAQAGVTDIHLLPVFDFASVPEHDCKTPVMGEWPGDSLRQQAAVLAVADQDCFNWGYDPLHYSAPEGSYATDPQHGEVRVREMRAMVQALHRAGLRVGMDVVYNHTFAAGQQPGSVLDRIVPGYYQRLNADGAIEHSTCCANTATEHLMMGKLVLDSVPLWATQYKIDSFRFDLMGHQPRALMEQLQLVLLRQTGKLIPLIGEGWNFGEVVNGARFVQASQLSLNGSGIGTFNDRLRDAVRGGGAGDSGAALVEHKGWINGQSGLDQLRSADIIRAGMAGSVRSYPLQTWDGKTVTSGQIDWGGQPLGYVAAPAEAVNYVENHDNQTLFDINALRLPPDTSRIDRARVQILGAAIVAFSQGIAYFHAGVDLLRSKSLDKNSFNSGDWFNRIDWRGQDNYFPSGLPPAPDNGKDTPWLLPVLNNPLVKPGAAEIDWTSRAFRDLLQIRSGSSLFHLASAAEIQQRLRFENVGPDQVAGVLIGHLDGANYPGANFGSIVYIINAGRQAQQIVVQLEKSKHYVLHPVLNSAMAADQRVRQEAHYDPASGQFSVPSLSVAVFVETEGRQ